MSGKSGLTTRELYALDRAVSAVLPASFTRGADGARTYLVGTAQTGGEYRDVDVRTILDDDEFNELFAPRQDVWGAWCFAIGTLLAQQTGLPIDYQVQRRADANARHSGPRNPLGLRDARLLAGGGDATPWSAS